MQIAIQFATVGIMVMLVGIVVTFLLGDSLFVATGKNTGMVVPIYMLLLFITGLITFWMLKPMFCHAT